jgi:hypothetical protein
MKNMVSRCMSWWPFRHSLPLDESLCVDSFVEFTRVARRPTFPTLSLGQSWIWGFNYFSSSNNTLKWSNKNLSLTFFCPQLYIYNKIFENWPPYLPMTSIRKQIGNSTQSRTLTYVKQRMVRWNDFWSDITRFS